MYEPTLGLEVHVELKTKSKMFCNCLNDPDEKIPNKNVCPVCLAHPGTLPTMNKTAVEEVLLVGLALGSEILEYSKFDRKNYFYPDLPKGYQISQYDMPLCKGGELLLFLSEDLEESGKSIKITRVHLEEDTAKLIHPADKKSALIDFNRAGVPLMELVTEPVMHSGKEARIFAQGLQLLLKHLQISKADMEKGQMRCEVNISLSKDDKLGTKVEIKNLNSFRAVEKAIDFEIERQKDLLEKGEKVIQETRGWDADKEITYSQRWKEEAQDYRYFPEPDLPPLNVHKLFNIKRLKASLPELPWEKKAKIIKDMTINVQPQKLGLTSIAPFVTTANLLIQDGKLYDWFEEVLNKNPYNSKQQKKRESFICLATNYFQTDLWGLMKNGNIDGHNLKVNSSQFVSLIKLLLEERISSRVAKDLLLEIAKKGGDPEQIIKKKGLEQISDEDQLNSVIIEIIKNNPTAVEDYKKGKTNTIQFLVGQAMAKTRGTAAPAVLEKLFKEQLS
jgi:aspartyl-tRNA(Asn)/glutamyl-tRNA(Gln) amidotransferase subunit B